MLDFLVISTRMKRQGSVEIYPKFIVKKSKDLMIRGRDFYAVWIEELGLWSTNEEDVIRLIDSELDKFAKEYKSKYGQDHITIMHMWDSDSGVIDSWHKYCQKQLRDNFSPLDENLIFSNQITNKSDYATKKLPYSLDEVGSTEAYDELMSTLYTSEERHKIEFCIGAVVTGASKKIQKFAVLYGPPGSGKSTVLNIIQSLFDGYFSVFDAESLGSSTDTFALEQFRYNPLVAISHDGDLSRIEKNTRLNSLISHETMTVNEKHRSTYSMRFNSFLFMGTNKPVRITDAKSGLLRRLIDINPSGNKLPMSKYNKLITKIDFELGAIANKCKNVYLEDPTYYNDYIPTDMMGESNDFYNFMLDSYVVFKRDDGTTLKAAWEMYKQYCDQARVPYPMAMRIFKSELKNYFREYEDRAKVEDEYIRSYYIGFKKEIFETNKKDKKDNLPKKIKEVIKTDLIDFKEQPSILDTICADSPAQYGYETGKGTPVSKWADVKTSLKDIDTSKLHFLKVPENHIVIDFDIKDENGNKSFEKNLEEASKWPKTYAELSKSGGGIHLHYIYNGDPATLSRIYADDIEIKVFSGNSSLRRMLTKCNNVEISTISSGLPKRENAKVINFETINSEKALRTIISKNINKEYHSATKPSVDFIYKTLEEAYTTGLKYDVSDMHAIILAFAASSSNQSDYCVKLVGKMKFKSDESSQSFDDNEKPIAFYDVEVYPNLFLINWKIIGKDKSMNRLINPKPSDIEPLIKNYRLVGFNNRRYDNHIIYACLLGYTNEQLYNLSYRIVNNQDRAALFAEAYNLSYTDIYDYATEKMGLKKWGYKLGMIHKEMRLPWDQPVDEALWPEISEYCDNDVYITEAVWEHTQGDFTARKVLAEISGGSVNDTTNTLTTRLIFGNDKNPELNYVNLENDFPGYEFVKEWNDKTKKYDKSNMYRGINLGFGGYVYAEPGMYGNVALLDIVSMHPTSAINMKYFGKYTPIFEQVVQTRVLIKNGQYDEAKTMFNGMIAKYLNNPEEAGALSLALKIAINSVYGLTSATFSNAFKDKRNVNNIVALRGALFMKTLQDELQGMGYKVVHIKTDSVKIADADMRAIEYCNKFAEMFGYTFEHEATYDRFAIVNDAVYVARHAQADECKTLYGYIPGKNKKNGGQWTATGTQFQVPYVFKTLFSKESILFEDMRELKQVNTGSIYIKKTENLYVDEEDLKFIGKIGQFTPVKPGCGGGDLVKPVDKKDGTVGYDAVIGAKGYLWLESVDVEERQLFDYIDHSYYISLVDDAVDTLNKHGDFEWFVSDEPYIDYQIKSGAFDAKI